MVAAAQRAHEEGPLRVGGGFLFGDASLVDEALHPGVVLGDLRQYAVTQQVGAGVADVDEAEALAGPEEGGEGGPHAFQLGVLLDHHPELVVGALHGGAERGEDVGAGHVVVESDDRGDHLGAGDLTGGLAAHSVGDREQAGTGVAGVLVALADHALCDPAAKRSDRLMRTSPVGSGYIRTVPTLRSGARRGPSCGPPLRARSARAHS